jgi:hypothetical protein
LRITVCVKEKSWKYFLLPAFHFSLKLAEREGLTLFRYHSSLQAGRASLASNERSPFANTLGVAALSLTLIALGQWPSLKQAFGLRGYTCPLRVLISARLIEPGVLIPRISEKLEVFFTSSFSFFT